MQVKIMGGITSINIAGTEIHGDADGIFDIPDEQVHSEDGHRFLLELKRRFGIEPVEPGDAQKRKGKRVDP